MKVAMLSSHSQPLESCIMCLHCPAPRFSRRGFLSRSAMLGGALGLGAWPLSHAVAASLDKELAAADDGATPAADAEASQAEATSAPATPADRTPEASLDALLAGNARHVAGTPLARDYAALRDRAARGQRPLAAILACSDARSVPEVVFDQSLGDLYVVRVAGNSVDPGALASMEYAVRMLNVPLLMVMGHTGCGVVDAAIRQVASGLQLPGHLDAITAPIAPAVNATRHEAGIERLQATIRENVQLNVGRLTQSDAILAPAVADGKVRVVAAMHDIRTGQVTLLDAEG